MPRNLLWIMADQHSGEAWAGGGHPLLQTPHLDGLAARGAVFDRAYTPSPVCVPARFAALTGLYPSQTGCVHNGTPLPLTVPTLAHHFQRAGYLTAFIGKLHPVAPHTHRFDYYVDFGHYYDYLGPQLEVYARGMGADDTGKGVPWIDVYQEPRHSWNLIPVREGLPTHLAEPDQFESFVVREALRFVNTYGHQPFALVVSFLRPHAPLTVPERYHRLYPPSRIELPSDSRLFLELNPYLRSRQVDLDCPRTRERAVNYLSRYYAAVSYVDDCVGALLQGLAASGVLDNTMVAYTSDHGDMLLHRGMFGKFVFYEPAVRVPLIVSGPGIPAGSRIPWPVDHTDLLPSFLDALGLPIPTGLGGSSWWPGLRNGGPPHRTAVFSEMPLAQGETLWMARQGPWKLITYPDGFRELFNLEEDPGETQNQAAAQPQITTAMERLLAEHQQRLGAQTLGRGDPTPFGRHSRAGKEAPPWLGNR